MLPTVKASDGSEFSAAQQPYLHEASVVLYAPSQAVSQPSGQLTGGADGFYHADRRVLSVLTVSAEGVETVPVGCGTATADQASFRYVLRGLGARTPDPAVTLTRHRSVRPGLLQEVLEVVNAGPQEVSLRLVAEAAGDFATMADVKSGARPLPLRAEHRDGGLCWSRTGQAGPSVQLTATSPAECVDPETGRLVFSVSLPPDSRWQTTLRCTVQDGAAPDHRFRPAPEGAAPFRAPRVSSANPRLDHWVHRSVTDLHRLLLTDPQEPDDFFLAAGAPWYLTLFGRDALWAARMTLPLGTDLAAGTLRVLARRQGNATDEATQEQPGKILHEVRETTQVFGGGLALPPCYYGTVDATPLWVTVLHDAWRWGLDREQVEALLPHAQAALRWMMEYGDADGDGLLEYVGHPGGGLANQGWRDSGDAVRHRDGRLAAPPIALVEMQGYAYEAARNGAALLRAFDRDGADHCEEWAAALRQRVRERFWVSDETGPYPAMALDGGKRPADAVTSSCGHLLGTGLLDPAEAAALAQRLQRPELDSGFGLRTLAAGSGGYNPLGYHIGSVWPHDTAIAVHGLIREGFPEAAASLASGLIAASAAFDGRLPELYSGHGAREQQAPTPYPASCRPQAWAAASSVLVLRALLGLEPDVPGGTLTVAPVMPATGCRPLSVSGLRVAGEPLAVTLAADGAARVETRAPVDVRIL